MKIIYLLIFILFFIAMYAITEAKERIDFIDHCVIQEYEKTDRTSIYDYCKSRSRLKKG